MDENYPPDLTPSFQNPLSINQGYNVENSPVPNQIFTYKTPCNCINCLIPGILFFMGGPISILMIVLGIINDNIKIILCSFVPLIFVITAIVVGNYYTLYHSITINQFEQIVIIKSIKLCCCCNKTNVVPIDQIGRVIVQIDHSRVYRENKVTYEAFEIIFELNNGTKVIGCSGILNINNEGQKAMDILRSGLPLETYFDGDFVKN